MTAARPTSDTVFDLKPLDRSAIAAAIEKAQHYRLLNEPLEAESICLDVLELDPENEDALIILVLSLTDQFEARLQKAFGKAQAAAGRLADAYDRVYYSGLISERRAKAHLDRGGPGSGHVAYEWFRKAMDEYEEAGKLNPESADPTLRWNTCARIIMSHPELEEEPHSPHAPFLDAGPGMHQ